MVSSQFRTLLSLLIVLALGVAFVWGGTRLLNTVTGAASPLPTPTIKPVVEQPTTAPSARQTQRTHAHATATAQPTAPASKRPAPHPTATPNTPPKVFMTVAEDASGPTTKFPVGLSRIYCWVRNRTLPSGTPSVTFYWTRDEPNGFISQFALAVEAGNAYTGAYPPSSVNLNPGKYRCDVIVNDQTFGSAHFTVGP